MSTLFFDNLLDLKDVEDFIKTNFSSEEEKEDFNTLVDGFVTTWVMDKVLENFPEGKREEFMEFFLANPHDEEAVLGYIHEHTGKDMRDELAKQSEGMSKELLDVFGKPDETNYELNKDKDKFSEGKPSIS